LYDLRIRNPFPTVSLRVHASYTEAVHDLRISPFFSVNGRLRSCMFDLGNLGIFSRPSYTESVSCRSAPYAMIVYGDRARSSFLCVSLRKRSFTTVPLRPGPIVELKEERNKMIHDVMC